MILEIFSVFDVKAEAYLPPFFLPRVAMAKRAFMDCANDPKHQFGANPADYNLFHMGSFDDSNGQWNIFPASDNLGCAITYISTNEEV